MTVTLVGEPRERTPGFGSLQKLGDGDGVRIRQDEMRQPSAKLFTEFSELVLFSFVRQVLEE